MSRKTLIIAHCLIAFLLLPGLCNAAETEEKLVTHVVIAWLKPEFRTAEYMRELLKANERLREIPQVQSLQIGNAIKSKRKMVDDSFDIANAITFKSQQDMNDYLSHPVHVEFFEQYIKGKVEKAMVFDF